MSILLEAEHFNKKYLPREEKNPFKAVNDVALH